MNDEPVVLRCHSVLDGIVWPAIGDGFASQLQSLLFQLEYSQWLPENVLRAQQLAQLKPLLRHAQSTVPHYSQVLQGLDANTLTWDAFRALPLLTPKQLQVEFESLKSAAVPPGHGGIAEGKTSGSTGIPLHFLVTEVTQLFWNALTVREHLWHARDFSGKLAAIRVKVEEGYWRDWGSPVAKLFHTGPLATLNVRTSIEKQLDWLVQQNPDYLITHASNLLALAELSLRRGIRLPRLRQARSFSEALRSDLRETVNRAWGVTVADVYSCEEAGHIALQCPHNEHYHVQSENLLVEILDEAGQPCKPGDTGRVVITTLHNFAMPLIRYALDDYAVVGGPCSCGRTLPVLAKIHGRRRNMIVLPDGQQHWPSFPRIRYTGVAPISQIRLIQRTLHRVDAIFTAERPLTSGEHLGMVAAIQESLGYPFEVELIAVDEMPRQANMKFEDIISEVAAGNTPG